MRGIRAGSIRGIEIRIDHSSFIILLLVFLDSLRRRIPRDTATHPHEPDDGEHYAATE